MVMGARKRFQALVSVSQDLSWFSIIHATALRPDTGDKSNGIKSTGIGSTVFQHEVLKVVIGVKCRGLATRNIFRYVRP